MGRIRSYLVVLAAGLAAVLVTAGPASAEMFLDVYGGAAFFNDPTFTVTTNNGLSREKEKGSADTDWTWGGRLGYWFSEQGLPWLGLAADVSYMEPDYKGSVGDLHVKVRTVPMSPLLMLRLPLAQSPDYPGGQFYLYGAAGPGFFWTEQTARGSVIGERISSDTVEVGLDVRGGLAWQFLPNWKMFAEYRFTSYSISHSQRGTKVEADLDANSGLFGIGYSFK